MLGSVTGADRVMCSQDATTARDAASQAQYAGSLTSSAQMNHGSGRGRFHLSRGWVGTVQGARHALAGAAVGSATQPLAGAASAWCAKPS
jgi:hypothetical protein